MGAALVGGLLQGGWPAADLAVVELSATRAAQLGDMFPGVTVVADSRPGTPAASAGIVKGDVIASVDVEAAAATYGLTEARGAYVSAVTAGAPAEKAGLQTGDNPFIQSAFGSMVEVLMKIRLTAVIAARLRVSSEAASNTGGLSSCMSFE